VPGFEIRALNDADREWVTRLLTEHWSSPRIVSRGRVCDGDRLPGFATLRDGQPIGLATYRIENDACEIVTLNSLSERQGVGSALIDAVKGVARAASCRRLWLVTTNDNVFALGFYQRRGFDLVAVHRGAMAEARRQLKPEIPLVGLDGIPLRDEIELELTLP
jgi:GNAT superfamily N-acetyltransferase